MHVEVAWIFAEQLICHGVAFRITFGEEKQTNKALFVFLETVRVLYILLILLCGTGKLVVFIVFFGQFPLGESRVGLRLQQFVEFVDGILRIYREICAGIFHICFGVFEFSVELCGHFIHASSVAYIGFCQAVTFKNEW